MRRSRQPATCPCLATGLWRASGGASAVTGAGRLRRTPAGARRPRDGRDVRPRGTRPQGARHRPPGRPRGSPERCAALGCPPWGCRGDGALVIGSTVGAGAAPAEEGEFIADGAAWVWDRAARLTRLAESPVARRVRVRGFLPRQPIAIQTRIPRTGTYPRSHVRRWTSGCGDALRPQADRVEVGLDEVRAWPRRGETRPSRVLGAPVGGTRAACRCAEAHALQRLWPGRECGTAGEQAALQGPRVTPDGKLLCAA